MSEKKVNYQFKLLYFIAIILVVQGHSGGIGHIDLLEILFPRQSYHLALFVFASGYFYNKVNESNVLQYVWKKIKHLIIPLYLWNIVYAGIVLVLKQIGFSMWACEVTFRNIFYAPIVNGQQFLLNLGGWFVIPLFFVEIINILIRKCICMLKNEALKDCIILILGIFGGIVGIYLANQGFNGIGWWRTITRTLYFLPFYEIGYCFHLYFENRWKINNGIYFGIIFLMTASLVFINKGRYDITPSTSKFGGYNPFIVLLIGVLPIAFWLRVTKILTPIFGQSKIVNLVADNAYSIMINQFLGFFIVKFFFYFISLNTMFCNGFDEVSFHTKIFYYYYPKGIKLFSIIYAVVGIAVAIIIQSLVNKLKSGMTQLVKNHGLKKCEKL